MKYLVFLFWIPALIVLHLSIHQEIQAERDRTAREKRGVMAHPGHPHLGQRGPGWASIIRVSERGGRSWTN
jgi:hypothetical protein